MTDGKKGSKFTFDSFEITKANSKAFEKAKQFAENADSKPLAIFGGTEEPDYIRDLIGTKGVIY